MIQKYIFIFSCVLQTHSRDGQDEKLNYTIDENSTAAQRYSTFISTLF